MSNVSTGNVITVSHVTCYPQAMRSACLV